jgi:oligopeptide/dipeptide ABC transporter ATP-binding protein
MQADANLLEVTDLVKNFPIPHSKSAVHAVGGVSFDLRRGETLALVGESGSGKTTVGKCILKLLEPTSGTITFAGANITVISRKRFRSSRARIQLVFQEPYDSLDPRMTIERVVEEPMVLAGVLSRSERRARCEELMGLVRLDTDHLSRYPHQLSAGQQQRIGIARAIATNPDLVVLDEPTSALDISVRAEIIELLKVLQEKLRMAYLFISHDLMAVRRIAHRIAVMYMGQIVESGTADDVFSQQLHPYSHALLSSVLYPDPNIKPSRFRLQGEIPSPINLPSGCYLHSRCPLAVDTCKHVPPKLEWRAGRLIACHRADDMVGVPSNVRRSPSGRLAPSVAQLREGETHSAQGNPD